MTSYYNHPEGPTLDKHHQNNFPVALEVLKRAERELIAVSKALGTDDESRTAECGRKMAALCRATIKNMEEVKS